MHKSRITAPGMLSADHLLDAADPFIFFFNSWGWDSVECVVSLHHATICLSLAGLYHLILIVRDEQLKAVLWRWLLKKLRKYTVYSGHCNTKLGKGSKYILTPISHSITMKKKHYSLYSAGSPCAAWAALTLQSMTLRHLWGFLRCLAPGQSPWIPWDPGSSYEYWFLNSIVNSREVGWAAMCYWPPGHHTWQAVVH